MEFVTNEVFGVISVTSGFFGLGLYLYAVFYKGAKPHYFTWLLWSFLTGLVFFAQVSEGAGPGAWVIGLSAAGCFSIAVFGYFRGEKVITLSDKLAFGFGLLAIPIWYFTKNPFGAVVLASIIDCVGFYPTFRKTWIKPLEEPLDAYVVSIFTMFTSILALETTNMTTTLYPAVLATANAVFVIMVVYRRKAMSKCPVLNT